MKKPPIGTTAGLFAVTLSLGLVGCGSSTDTAATTTPTSAETTAATTTTTPAADEPDTINDYIVENDIAETPIKPGEPGTPNVDFPLPPQWRDAGDATPDWAYGAILYDHPTDPNNPPDLYAIASKLTGDVDAAKILELAPQQLREMAEFKPLGEPEKTALGGFDAISFAGTYMNDGQERFVAQKTVVMPAADGLFVLQLNGDSLASEQNVVLDAADVINEQTTITLPQ
ncbi:LpqN/LpqT family lipoprotein [Mycolicibacterium sp. XJ879]